MNQVDQSVDLAFHILFVGGLWWIKLCLKKNWVSILLFNSGVYDKKYFLFQKSVYT